MPCLWLFRQSGKKFSRRPNTRRFSCLNDEMSSGLKTILIAAYMATAALPALTAERGPDAPGPAFAACAGRFSAVMEHAWMNGEAGEDARAVRDVFVALTEAAGDPGDSGFLLDTRFRAKQAQARLLQQGSFHTDRALARRAAAMALRQRRLCEAMILG